MSNKGIAFCGLKHGHIFSLYDLAKENKNVYVTGAWDDDENYAEPARKKITEKFYCSYEELLADKHVDIVAVGDSYGERGREIIKALEAGKHVLSDKPVCIDMKELERIRVLCIEKNLKVGCMLDLRYDPALRLVRGIVKDGLLGEIHAINFTGQHPLSYGSRPGWYFEKGRHGGTFNDIIIHGIDAVEYITGLGKIEVLCARNWNAFAKSEPDFCDCAQLMGRYANGAGLLADVSYSAPNGSAYELPSYWRFSFWGENGMAECKLGSDEVLLALANEEIRHLKPPDITENCLSELLAEIEGKSVNFEQKLLFETTQNCLEIQKVAERQNDP